MSQGLLITTIRKIAEINQELLVYAMASDLLKSYQKMIKGECMPVNVSVIFMGNLKVWQPGFKIEQHSYANRIEDSF